MSEQSGTQVKRAVVTGGAGFIGSHVVLGLLKQGYEVCIIDNCSTGLKSNLGIIEKESGKKVDACFTNIESPEAKAKIVSFKPQLIFHLAAQANVRKSVADPIFDATTNILGTINLLEGAREAGVTGFVFSSTGGAIYGEQEHFPADESHRTTPECPYGVSKRAGEVYLEYYARSHGIRALSLRYANVFGPRQNPKGEAGVVAVFTDRLLAGEQLVVNGDGEQTRDFVFVDDVVKANLLGGQSLLDGKQGVHFDIFNVGRSEEISVNDVVRGLRTVWRETAGEEGDKDFTVTFGAAMPGEQRRSVVDTTKIQRELGWKSDVGFEEGLLLTIRSFRQAQQ